MFYRFQHAGGVPGLVKKDALASSPKAGKTPHATTTIHARGISKDDRKDDGFEPFHFIAFKMSDQGFKSNIPSFSE